MEWQAIGERQLQIRRYKRIRLSNEEIINRLRKEKNITISERTLYHDLEEIQRQDQKWLFELGKSEFVSYYRLTLEGLETKMQVALSMSQTATDERVKLDALKLAADLEITIMNLVAKGPTVMAVKKQFESVPHPVAEPSSHAETPRPVVSNADQN